MLLEREAQHPLRLGESWHKAQHRNKNRVATILPCWPVEGGADVLKLMTHGPVCLWAMLWGRRSLNNIDMASLRNQGPSWGRVPPQSQAVPQEDGKAHPSVMSSQHLLPRKIRHLTMELSRVAAFRRQVAATVRSRRHRCRSRRLVQGKQRMIRGQVHRSEMPFSQLPRRCLCLLGLHQPLRRHMARQHKGEAPRRPVATKVRLTSSFGFAHFQIRTSRKKQKKTWQMWCKSNT
mmetsp:Transcript_68097/g.163433  ORF Transcript_68097/g.163433 Transcript_68097/m.163433 type:complete len:234 (+) Transcript_68097:177-878(+)